MRALRDRVPEWEGRPKVVNLPACDIRGNADLERCPVEAGEVEPVCDMRAKRGMAISLVLPIMHLQHDEFETGSAKIPKLRGFLRGIHGGWVRLVKKQAPECGVAASSG